MSFLTGDWEKLNRFLNPVLLSQAVDEHFGQASAKNALLVQRNIVLGLRKGRPEWPPLSPSTLKSKRKRGKTKTLIDTAEMMKSVRVIKVNDVVYFVGIPKGNKNRKRKGRPTIAEYAAKHEFGQGKRKGKGAKIPKRPFIQPGFDESLDQVVKNYDNAGRNVIKNLTR